MNPHHIPLLEALRSLIAQGNTLFCTPGHKQGRGVSDSIAQLLGTSLFQADFPDLPGLNLFDPEGILAESQRLAAETFGADRTWFLVNGSSCGVMAAILATCCTGDKIILPRTAHQSAIAGLILSGAWPVFINPEYDSSVDLVGCPTPETIAQMLHEHSETKAVLIVSPTYQGICADVAAIAAVTHAHNIPLIVDEAHGAHFHFHPLLPQAALDAGADITIQSTHKVLSALTQASMLHLKGTRIAAEQVQRALQLVQSTSPSNILLASLDAARQQMETEGYVLLEKTLELSDKVRSQLRVFPNLSVLDESQIGRPGFHALDLTRLTIQLSKLGMDGFTVDEYLQQHNVICELPMFRSVTFIITIGNTIADINCLIEAFQGLVKLTDAHTSEQLLPVFPEQSLPQPSIRLSPRDAFFSASEIISLDQAKGCINTEVICPYPPGIPILLPGEEVTPDAIYALKSIISQGGFVSGGMDTTHQTLKVVKQ